MPRPRFTIARLMIAVVVVAADVAILRGAERNAPGYGSLVSYLVVPSATLWCLVAIRVTRDLLRTGEAKPFAFGYLAGGLAASVASFAAFSADPHYLMDYLDLASRPVEWLAGGMSDEKIGFGFETLAYSLSVGALAAPQVLGGLLGGGIASRIGLTLATRRRLHPPEAAPSLPAAGPS